MRVFIRRENGDCWSGEEWVNLNVVVGARDACDFQTVEAATGCLEAALATDTDGQFATARVAVVTPRDEQD